MQAGTANELKFAIMRVRAHAEAVSILQTGRAIAVLRDARIDAAVAMNLGTEALTGICNGKMLDQLEELARLAHSGRVLNYESWLRGLLSKPGKAISAAQPWAVEARTRATTQIVDMHKAWGIDFPQWKQRLQASGIRGDLEPIIDRAKGSGPDAIAARGELRAAERAYSRGHDVEMLTPVSGKNAKQGESSPEGKLITASGEQRKSSRCHVVT